MEKTFVERCMDRSMVPDQINEFLCCWQKGQPAHVVLGFTEAEYALWQEQPTALTVGQIVELHRPGSRPKTFIEYCVEGSIQASDVDSFCEIWRSTPGNDGQPLSDFLGMTAEEYARWVKEPYDIHNIIEAHRPVLPVTDREALGLLLDILIGVISHLYWASTDTSECRLKKQAHNLRKRLSV